MRMLYAILAAAGVEALFFLFLFVWAVGVGALSSHYLRARTEKHFEGQE